MDRAIALAPLSPFPSLGLFFFYAGELSPFFSLFPLWSLEKHYLPSPPFFFLSSSGEYLLFLLLLWNGEILVPPPPTPSKMNTFLFPPSFACQGSNLSLFFFCSCFSRKGGFAVLFSSWNDVADPLLQCGLTLFFPSFKQTRTRRPVFP